MAEDLENHRAELIAAGAFTQADLDHFRATALDPARGEPPAPSAVQVATGFVRTFVESGKYTHYKLIVDGQLLDVASHDLFKLIVDGATYRVFYRTDRDRLDALEPVRLAEVPDAVAEAVVAAGLDPANPEARTDERVVSIVRDRLLVGLGRGLDFTPLDLAANRTGRLTPREQGKLRTTAAFGFGCATFWALIGGIVAASVASQSVVAVVVIGAVTLVLFLALVAYGLRARRDAAAGRVISGVGRMVQGGSGDGQLVIDADTSFRVPLRAFSMRGHQPNRITSLSYCIYYAPHENEVMSLEPVDLGAVLARPDLPIG